MNISEEVIKSSQKKISFMDVKSDEYYRQEHAVNTAVLSIMMGTKMGLKEKDLQK